MPSEEHDELEVKAAVWLRQQGFTDITTETKIVVVGELAGSIAHKTRNPYRTTRTSDVIGWNNTHKAIVECGGVRQPDKLRQFVDLASKYMCGLMTQRSLICGLKTYATAGTAGVGLNA